MTGLTGSGTDVLVRLDGYWDIDELRGIHPAYR